MKKVCYQALLSRQAGAIKSECYRDESIEVVTMAKSGITAQFRSRGMELAVTDV